MSFPSGKARRFTDQTRAHWPIDPFLGDRQRARVWPETMTTGIRPIEPVHGTRVMPRTGASEHDLRLSSVCDRCVPRRKPWVRAPNATFIRRCVADENPEGANLPAGSKIRCSGTYEEPRTARSF